MQSLAVEPQGVLQVAGHALHQPIAPYIVHLLLMALQVACTLPGGTSAGAKELILGRITATLAAYRKYCATSSSTVRIQNS
jgi:hypothetical protein